MDSKPKVKKPKVKKPYEFSITVADPGTTFTVDFA